MKENYQLILDSTIEEIRQRQLRPRLLLHSCCGPCSSYILEYLSEFFDITILYYNPNIFPPEEFAFRAHEQQRLITSMCLEHCVSFLEGTYIPDIFHATISGMENEPEGGARCHACYTMRLREAAIEARRGTFDYFTTTLSISPHKNSQVLNEIGKALSEKYNIPYLYSDFKKRDGYRRSCALSKEYEMYRQDYCGCIYSKMEFAHQRNP